MVTDPRVLRGVLALLALSLITSASRSYTIQPGDTLWELARHLGVGVTELAALNGITEPDRIIVGDVLEVPGATTGPGAPPNSTHVIAPGETLSQIAARAGVSVAELAEANGITDPNRILAGTELRVGDLPAVPETDHLVASAGSTHTVAAGETLSQIASRYDTTVADLVVANDLADANRIWVGQVLTVTGGGWRCPVSELATFINDYGVIKPDGRVHEGVDVFAPRGTPVVAPIAGVAEQVDGTLGGLQVWLHGDDGSLYIATHLDSFGAAGRVAAGEVIGAVGTSGNAAHTSPHVHFEVLLDGTNVNPYPLLEAACV